MLINLGEVHRRLGRPTRALRCFQESLEIDQELGDRYWEAHALEQLGDTHRLIGSVETAERAWRASQAILLELKHDGANRVSGKLATFQE